MRASKDQEPNRLLVAIVAPFYVAWLALRGAIEAIARAIDWVLRAIGDAIRWAWRPFRMGLQVVTTMLASLVRFLGRLLAPVARLLTIVLRYAATGLRALLREIGVLLGWVVRIVAPPLRALARVAVDIGRLMVLGAGRAGRAIGDAARWAFARIWPAMRVIGIVLEAVSARVAAGVRVVAGAIARVVGRSMAIVGRAVRWSWLTVVHVVRWIKRALVAALRPVIAAVRAALAVVRGVLGAMRGCIGLVASLVVQAVAPIRRALAAMMFTLFSGLASILRPALRAIANARLSARSAVARTLLAISAAFGPAFQPVRQAIEELRRLAPDVRGLRGEPQVAEGRQRGAGPPPAVGFAQAHRSSAVSSPPSGAGRRTSPIVLIAVTVAVILVLVAIIDETLEPGQATTAALSLLLGSVIAGLITAPQHVGEGVVGFVLGCALTVGVGLLIPNVGGSAEANPVPAFLSLVIVGGIAYAPGWAIGGRRHRRAAASWD
jgi:hypothetical protein